MINVNKQKYPVLLIHKRREETGSKLGSIAVLSEEHVVTTLSLKASKMSKFSMYTTSTKSVLREQRKNREESCNKIIHNFFHPKLYTLKMKTVSSCETWATQSSITHIHEHGSMH